MFRLRFHLLDGDHIESDLEEILLLEGENGQQAQALGCQEENLVRSPGWFPREQGTAIALGAPVKRVLTSFPIAASDAGVCTKHC